MDRKNGLLVAWAKLDYEYGLNWHRPNLDPVDGSGALTQMVFPILEIKSNQRFGGVCEP